MASPLRSSLTSHGNAQPHEQQQQPEQHRNSLSQSPTSSPRNDKSKEAILNQSSKGWTPGSPTSPLRIQKRSLSPVKGLQSPSMSLDNSENSNEPRQPRRTSSSFKQLQRNLVSNSPFVQSPNYSPSDSSSNSPPTYFRQPRSAPAVRQSRVPGDDGSSTGAGGVGLGLGLHDTHQKSPEPASSQQLFNPHSPLLVQDESSEQEQSPELHSAPFFQHNNNNNNNNNNHGVKKRQPRQTMAFNTLKTRKYVSNSPFVNPAFSPQSSPELETSSAFASQPQQPQGVLSQPKRMTGPRSPSPVHPSAAAAHHQAEVDELGRSQRGYHDDDDDRNKNTAGKTVTWGGDHVREFVKDDFEFDDSSEERRSSAASAGSLSQDSDEGGVVVKDLDDIPSAEEMVQRLMREEAEQQACLESSFEEDPQRQHLSDNQRMFTSSPNGRHHDDDDDHDEADLSGRGSPSSVNRRPLPVLPPSPPPHQSQLEESQHEDSLRAHESINFASLAAELGSDLSTRPSNLNPDVSSDYGEESGQTEEQPSAEPEEPKQQMMSPVRPLQPQRGNSSNSLNSQLESTSLAPPPPTTVGTARNGLSASQSSFGLPQMGSSSPLFTFDEFTQAHPPQSAPDTVAPLVSAAQDAALKATSMQQPSASVPAPAPAPAPVQPEPEPEVHTEEEPASSEMDSEEQLSSSPHRKRERKVPPRLTREAIQERMRQKREAAGLPPAAPSTPPKHSNPFTSSLTDQEGDEEGPRSPLSKLGADVHQSPQMVSRTSGMLSPMLPPRSPDASSSKQEHEEGIIAARRRMKEKKGERPAMTRRRSHSASDADLRSSRTSRHSQQDAIEEEGSALRQQPHIDPAAAELGKVAPPSSAGLPNFGAHTGSFSQALGQQLQQTYENVDKTYRTVEHRVVAGDSVQTVGNAGDVQKPKAWRRINRPSDMNAYASELRELRSKTPTKKPAGVVFLKLLKAKWAIPMPRHPLQLHRSLANSETASKSEDTVLMLPEMDLADEWELQRRQSLTFTVAFEADIQPYLRTLSMDSPSLSHKSSGGGLRCKIFGSPKKQRPASTMTPAQDPFLSYMSSGGRLALAQIDFEQCRAQCIGRRARFSFPLVSPSSGMQLGTLDAALFYLPPLAGLSIKQWPGSMADCEEGVRLLQKSSVEQKSLHKGELSQVGADCKFWRRRLMVIKGMQLIAFNEVTKRPHTCFDLMKLSAVEDCSQPLSHVPPTFSQASRAKGHRLQHSDPEEEPYSDVPHSFRLIFEASDGDDPEVVYFYADDEPSKLQWLEIIRHVVRSGFSGPGAQPPLWAVYMRELLASQGKVRESSSQKLSAMSEASSPAQSASTTHTPKRQALARQPPPSMTG